MVMVRKQYLKRLWMGGATSLGVATLQEGIDLRKAGIHCPILVLGNLINSEDLESCLSWDLMLTLSSAREALLCQNLAKDQEKEFSVHIKVDTGMTRLGCDIDQASSLVDLVEKLSNVGLKGIYSHLALADAEKDTESELFNFQQKKRFEDVLSRLNPKTSNICRHIANSAGTLRYQNFHFDMVRVGLALYGYSPIDKFKNDFLEPALAVRARVTLVRDVSSGTGVSYGHKFKTKRSSRLAVVGIGYADGVNRALSGKISVLINGKAYPQVGAITMDQLVIDITDAPEIEIGAVVTLLGVDGSISITPYEWSQISGSIPWEILCGFKYRLPRVVI